VIATGGPVVNIAIVDDHPILRFAVRELLGKHRADLSIVGEAETAREALAIVEAQHPDLVLMDILLPGSNGIAATREISRVSPKCRVLIYTTLTEPVYAVEALSAGAAGYALKGQSLEVLAQAIGEVAEGKRYIAPSIEEALGRERWSSPTAGGFASLSAREKEVFDLVVAGNTNRNIAGALFISERTVETHRSRINRKLAIHSTAELIRFAARQQMISV
jgi:DNA-binding NarL/FixJ family response regulator